MGKQSRADLTLELRPCWQARSPCRDHRPRVHAMESGHTQSVQRQEVSWEHGPEAGPEESWWQMGQPPPGAGCGGKAWRPLVLPWFGSSSPSSCMLQGYLWEDPQPHAWSLRRSQRAERRGVAAAKLTPVDLGRGPARRQHSLSLRSCGLRGSNWGLSRSFASRAVTAASVPIAGPGSSKQSTLGAAVHPKSQRQLRDLIQS